MTNISKKALDEIYIELAKCKAEMKRNREYQERLTKKNKHLLKMLDAMGNVIASLTRCT